MRLASMPFFTSQVFTASARWRDIRLLTVTLPFVSHQPVTVTFMFGFSFNVLRISFNLVSSFCWMSILLKVKYMTGKVTFADSFMSCSTAFVSALSTVSFRLTSSEEEVGSCCRTSCCGTDGVSATLFFFLERLIPNLTPLSQTKLFLCRCSGIPSIRSPVRRVKPE